MNWMEVSFFLLYMGKHQRKLSLRMLSRFVKSSWLETLMNFVLPSLPSAKIKMKMGNQQNRTAKHLQVLTHTTTGSLSLFKIFKQLICEKINTKVLFKMNGRFWWTWIIESWMEIRRWHKAFDVCAVFSRYCTDLCFYDCLQTWNWSFTLYGIVQVFSLFFQVENT